MRIAGVWPVAMAASLALAPGQAGAQFGYGRGYGGYGGYGGGGFGYGFGLYYYSPASPEPLLNQRALMNGARATMGPVSRDVYANNPAAYIYHLRDPGYLDSLDVATRRRIEAEIGRYSDGPPPPRRPDRRGPAAVVAPAPPAPRPRAAPAEVVPPPPRDPGRIPPTL